MTTSLSDLRADLRRMADPLRADASLRFFQTGPGQYAEGDRFMGVNVPAQRKIAKRYADLPLTEVKSLLRSPIHEERLVALFILVDLFRRGDQKMRKRVHDLYLAHTGWVNNWDLVDSSAGYIVGVYLDGKHAGELERLARSKSVWERRIAIVATSYDIMQGRSSSTFRIADMLMHDEHPLIHKAVGWMLREVGKRCSKTELERFLRVHAAHMPRTMLRYALEHFSETERQRYLHAVRRRIR